MNDQQYNNLLYYLTTNLFPESLTISQREQLQKQARFFEEQHNLLYKNKNNIRVRVIRTWKMEPVLYMFHNDPTAAYTSKERMMEKMKKRYYWPQMFENIKVYVESCDSCQRRGKAKRNEPLHQDPEQYIYRSQRIFKNLL